VILGTAAYMSPEQAKGKPVDKRTDVWAFGAVLFEMLTGKRPFAGADVSETLAYVLTKEPDWSALPEDVPPALRTYLMRCLEKNRRERVRDIGDVRLALSGAFDGAAPSAQTPAPSRRLAIVASIATAIGVWGVMRLGSPPPASQPVSRLAYTIPDGERLRNISRGRLAASPDGRRFVYNTTGGLRLRSMDELDSRLLPGTDTAYGVFFFSPDGQSIAFWQGGQLKRLAISGGASIVICDLVPQPFGAHWAADGMIYVANNEGVLRVSSEGGTPELVVPAPDGGLLDAPQMLPDGDTLLLSEGSRNAVNVWDEATIVAVSVSTGERHVLVEGGADARYVETGHLVYAFASGLLAVQFDVGRLRTEGGPVSLVDGLTRSEGTASANYAVAEDGTLFYLSSAGTGETSLVWVDRGGRGETIEAIPPGFYRFPRLSPDGDRVLVNAAGDATIYDLASGREARLTSTGAVTYVGWSPSGDAVTYTAGNPTEAHVFIQPADGSSPPRQLTAMDGGRVDFDSWAPDGRTFAAHHHTIPTTQLMVAFDGETAEPTTWLDHDHGDLYATFSPDGRYVAHVSTLTGRQEIYIRPFPGPGGQTTVSVGGGREPVWGPTGELFYLRSSDATLMVVDVTTEPELSVGPPVELFSGFFAPYGGGSATPRYDAARDGQRFITSASSVEGFDYGDAKVVIVQNWTEELKRLVPTND